MLEDSSEDAEVVHRLLKKEKFNFDFHLVLNKADFLTELDHFRPNVILADNSLPGLDALEALEIVQQSVSCYHVKMAQQLRRAIRYIV